MSELYLCLDAFEFETYGRLWVSQEIPYCWPLALLRRGSGYETLNCFTVSNYYTSIQAILPTEIRVLTSGFLGDPFSTVAGALGVADVCLRAGKYLRSVQKTAKYVDDEIDVLQQEVTHFESVYRALKQLCATSAADTQSADYAPPGLNDPCSALWSRAGDLTQEGHELVKKLQALLQTILGEELSTRFERVEDFRKAIKMLSKNSEYEKIRKRFTCLNLELTTMLTAIDL